MTNTFQLPRGIEVSNLTGIEEAYSVKLDAAGHCIFTLNVSAEKISSVFRELAAQVREPGLFVFEIPTHRDVEAQLRKAPTDPFHRDVYYLNCPTWERADELFSTHAGLLIHDGEVNFGFGSQSGNDEVLVGKYKIFYIFADDPEKYRIVLDRLAYEEVPELRTVCDNFTRDAPGRRHALMNEKPNIYQMVEQLKEEGLYCAGRQPD